MIMNMYSRSVFNDDRMTDTSMHTHGCGGPSRAMKTSVNPTV